MSVRNLLFGKPDNLNIEFRISGGVTLASVA